jgi:hypothetical protein
MAAPKKLPINQLIVGYKSMNESFIDCSRGRCSHSQHMPLDVLLLDPIKNNGVGGYLLTDGYHRLIEAMLRQEHEVLCQIDISGYSNHWAIPAVTFDFTDSPWQGLEEFADEDTLEEMRSELVQKNNDLLRFISEVIQQEASKITEPKRSGLSVDQLGLKPHGGVENIIKVYNQATPEEKDYWGRWYHNAKSDVEDLARQFNLPFPVVAGIVAVLSPGNKWSMNLLAAQKLLQGQTKINAYPRQAQRAQRILETGDTGLVSGPKVTVFFNSLMNPKLVEKDMVLDGHAINIWRGEKVTLKGLSTPNAKERALMIQDYQMAANELGVPVQAVQAVTWYIWKYTGKTPPLEAPTGVYDVSKFKNVQPANDISLDEVNAIGAGGIVGAGMGNGGTDASKKLMWSGHQSLKEMFYHGTSTILGLEPGMTLLPPDQTEKISEKGRKKNLDKVFFTKDIGSAKIYAGRAVNQFGGKPTIFSIEPVGEIELINPTPGSTVFMSPSAKITNRLLEVSATENSSTDNYMTLDELYGQYNTPDEDELLWEYVGYDEYNTVPFEIVHVNPVELANTERNKNFLDPKDMHKSDRARVRAFEKIADELSKKTIIVVDGKDIVDGFHRTVALSNKGVTTVRALDLSKPKPRSQ